MIYDLEESPIFNMITINGILTFREESVRLHLNAKHIYVKAGQLRIGNATHPHKYDAQITLHGEKKNANVSMKGSIEPGEKILANTGKISLYGLKRNKTISRLVREANHDDMSLYVEPGLVIHEDDKIAVLSSSYDNEASDFKEVEYYFNETGQILLKTPLKYYHWGQSKSTADEYNGVDMRSEVLLLSRNVQIHGAVDGQNIEQYGA